MKNLGSKIVNNPEKNKKLCEGCSICCEYVNILINKPQTKKAIDKIVWYLLHGVNICVDADGDWTVLMPFKCKFLNKEKICSIYSTRPIICREYSQSQCERYNKSNCNELLFTNEKEFLLYVKSNSILRTICNSD